MKKRKPADLGVFRYDDLMYLIEHGPVSRVFVDNADPVEIDGKEVPSIVVGTAQLVMVLPEIRVDHHIRRPVHVMVFSHHPPRTMPHKEPIPKWRDLLAKFQVGKEMEPDEDEVGEIVRRFGPLPTRQTGTLLTARCAVYEAYVNDVLRELIEAMGLVICVPMGVDDAGNVVQHSYNKGLALKDLRTGRLAGLVAPMKTPSQDERERRHMPVPLPPPTAAVPDLECTPASAAAAERGEMA